MYLKNCKIEKISVKSKDDFLHGVISVKVSGISPDDVSGITELIDGEANISLEKA